MSPTNAKALNTMRQRLKKHNLQFADEIARYKAAPESTEEEEASESEESESDSDSESDEEAAGDLVLMLARVHAQVARLGSRLWKPYSDNCWTVEPALTIHGRLLVTRPNATKQAATIEA